MATKSELKKQIEAEQEKYASLRRLSKRQHELYIDSLLAIRMRIEANTTRAEILELIDKYLNK